MGKLRNTTVILGFATALLATPSAMFAATITRSGVLPVNTWVDIGPCLSDETLLLPLTATPCGKSSGSTGPCDSTYIIDVGEGVRSAIFQWQNDVYIKAVKIQFKVESGILRVKATSALYVSSSGNDFPYDFNTRSSISQTLTGSESSSGYGLKNFTANVAGNDALLIAAQADQIGTPTPGYGAVTGLAAGESVPVSFPSTWTNDAENVSAACTGWKLYDAYGVVVDSGPSNQFTYVHPDPAVFRRLEWQLLVEHKVEATAGAGGSVSHSSQWLTQGDSATITATPVVGKAFSLWTGDVPNSAKYDNPLTLSFDNAPASVVANFATPSAERHWTGAGADALASNPDNWAEATVPAPLAAIVFDATGNGHPCTWDLDIPLQSWTQNGYTETVTFKTVYDVNGFCRLRIAGDCTLLSGKWTHLPNAGNSNVYRLKVDVGGDMTIGPDATIDVTGMGYMAHYEPFGVAKTSANEGASYGGRGFPNGAISTEPYGCYYAPEDPGNCGTWNKSSPREGAGGGVVTLTVGGSLVHNGLINANAGTPQSHYGGSGGSVYIVSGTISGTGRITSRAASANYCGAGGRIAVRLTGAGADFGNYDLLNLADATPPRTSNHGASGTIYGETAADSEGQGWLILKGNGTIQSMTSCYPTPFTKEHTAISLARLTLTNNVLMLLASGYTLDISGTEVIADDTSVRNGIYVDGGSLVIDPAAQDVKCIVKAKTPMEIETQTLTIGRNGNLWAYGSPMDFEGHLVVTNGGVVTATKPFSVDGDVSVLSGGKVTTTGPQAVPDHVLDFAVTGDLTVAEGGSITASGKGYSSGYGPFVNGNNTGSSHGGWGHGGAGTCTVPPYGSATDPRTHGAAGTSGSGGGVLMLTVGGALRNDGDISADGTRSSGAYHYGAAGGSVNITAASLSGAATGVISASAEATMHCSGCQSGVSGGGRVAVTLTGANSDFSGYAGAFKARGSRWSASANAGGAGTIYLRKGGHAIDEGTLIIDNDGSTASKTYETVLGGDISGTAFGSVIITNGAKVALAENSTISASRGWANHATFVAGANSEVLFAGTNEMAYAGSTTFANVGSAVPGKRIVFADGSTLASTALASFSGDTGTKLVLDSADATSTWTLNASSASLSDLEVNGCQSVTEVFVANGFGERNNANVIFGQVEVGAQNIWTGAVDSDWSVAGNWQAGRVPIMTDIAVIPGGTSRSPVLSASVTVAGLSVSNSASLSLGGKTMTVTGPTYSAGALDFTGGGTLVGQDAVSVSGTVSIGGDLRLEAASAQSVTMTGVAFQTIEVLSPTVSFSGGIDAATLRIGDGATTIAAAFANGMTVKATDFVVVGDTNSAPVSLSCATSGGTWRLNAVSASVTGAVVSGSDASPGALIVPDASTDRGGNVNWLFNDTRAHWTGAVDSAFDNAGNWASGTVPGANDDVVISGSTAAMIVSSPAAIHGISVESGATATINARLDVASAVSIGDGATIKWNVPGTIGGNLAVLPGGKLTHSSNLTTEANKLDLSIGGGGYVAAGASVNVSGMGYGYSSNKAYGPGGGTANNTGNTGASYGGRGYGGAGGVGKPCYGSYLCPTNCGSAGSWGDGGAGGGAVHLAFAGDLVVDGEIAADGGRGGTYYTGSGGSIWISAASLGGAGAIHATGSPTGGNSCFGGGGRIAIYTRTPDEIAAAFGGTILAHGGYLYTTGRSINGSAGTVYLENGSDGDGRGWVRIANRAGMTTRSDGSDKTDLPSPSLCDPKETRNAFFLVEEYGTLNLTADTKISDLTMDSTARLQLNGFTLRIKTREHALKGTIVAGGTAGNPGKIVWDGATILMLR